MYRFMFSINNINNGALKGTKAMPSKDSTSDGTSSFSLGRQTYVNSYSESNNTILQTKKWIGGNRDASVVTRKKSNNEIALGSLNAIQPNNLLSFTTYKDVNTVNDALTRVRGGGAVVPKKVINSPHKLNVPVSSFSPVGNKAVYGIKKPFLYH